MIHLGRTDTGYMIIASDDPLPSKIKRVEYYREQRTFAFCYENDEEDDQLSEYEVSEEISEIIKVHSEIIVFAKGFEGLQSNQYLCPLIQVGI